MLLRLFVLLFTLAACTPAATVPEKISTLNADQIPVAERLVEPAQSRVNKPRISIVMDDLGDNSIVARQIAALPATLTLAILPHTPHAQKLSRIGRELGHEIIMHMPMEAGSRPDLLGPGALFADMPQPQFLQTFLQSAASVPNLVGFNNHMGSLLTTNPEKMQWLMAVARQKQWYFLDSKTSQDSVAQEIAETAGLPTIGRDVFLDHHQESAQLEQILKKQLKLAKRIASKRGHVVVICHPYPQTLAFLAEEIPKLNKEFALVKLSELLPPGKTRLAKSERTLSDQIKPEQTEPDQIKPEQSSLEANKAE